MQIATFKSLFVAVCAAGFLAASADTGEAGLFDWLCHDDDEYCYDPCCPPPVYQPSCCAPAAYAPPPSCGCAAPAHHGVGYYGTGYRYHGAGYHGVGYRSRYPYGVGGSAFYPRSVRGPRPYLYGY